MEGGYRVGGEWPGRSLVLPWPERTDGLASSPAESDAGILSFKRKVGEGHKAG